MTDPSSVPFGATFEMPIPYELLLKLQGYEASSDGLTVLHAVPPIRMPAFTIEIEGVRLGRFVVDGVEAQWRSRSSDSAYIATVRCVEEAS